MWTTEEQTRWQRNLKAMVRSAGNNDPDAFAALVEMASWLNTDGLRDAFHLLHAQGFTGGEVARCLGISRQAVHDRFVK